MHLLNAIHRYTAMTNLITVATPSLLLLASLAVISATFTGDFKMDVSVLDEHVDVTWKFNSSQKILGFRAVIYNSNSKDSAAEYESPLLDSTEKQIALTHKFKGGSHKICVFAMTNETDSLAQSCEDVDITDLKIVVGILAGVVFLIPCLVALFYIICKDRRVRADNNDNDDYDDTKPMIKGNGRPLEVAITLVSEKSPMKGHLNDAFVHDTKTIRKLSKTDDVKKGAVDITHRTDFNESTSIETESAKAVTQADVAQNKAVQDLNTQNATTTSTDATETEDSQSQNNAITASNIDTDTENSTPVPTEQEQAHVVTSTPVIPVPTEQEQAHVVTSVQDDGMDIETDNVNEEVDGKYRSSVAINVKATKPISDRSGHESDMDNSDRSVHGNGANTQPTVIEISIPEDSEHI